MKRTIQKTTTLALMVAMILTAAANVQAQKRVNMNRYITLTVQSGQKIRLKFWATTDNTPVRIVSGSNTQNISVGTEWARSAQDYTSDGTTMTIYGDITGLDCNGNEEKLTALDVSNNTKLDLLSCYANRLSNLDVSKNTMLTRLYCHGNQLTALDVSKNTMLCELSCSYNQLTSLDVSKNMALTGLDCRSNQLDACALDDLFRSLPARQASDGAMIIIKDAASTNPGADSCRTPIANDKNWKTMDNNKEIKNTNFTCPKKLPSMSRYITLTVQSGQKIRLKFWATTDNTPVRIVSGSNTQNISVGTEWARSAQDYTSDGTTMTIYGDITGLDCNSNREKLTALDVSRNTELIELHCSENQLTTLDVNKNTALQILSCYENKLTSLDISKNTRLTKLFCALNQLTFLDVSKNTELTDLYCDSSKLTLLDVSKNTELTQLSCSGNQLTTLDVSKNTKLTYLYCDSNKFTSLDVSKNTELTQLYCYGNKLNACALDDLFRSLPAHKESDYAAVHIKNRSSTNPGKDSCRTPIANDKNWMVMDYNNGDALEIKNTNFTCRTSDLKGYRTVGIPHPLPEAHT